MSVRRKSFLAFLAVPLIVMLSIAGLAVANAAKAPAARNAAQPQTPTITISMFAYHTPASVPRGATIRVVNKDSAPHTVSSDQKSRFNVNVPAHSTRTFKAPIHAGTYKFHCTYHPSMHGILHVK